jgi:hypothetical protein
MKYLISSVTIGACLLLSSAGDVFAGQQGTGGTGVAGCGGTPGVGPAVQPSPQGQIGNTTTHSPFPTNGGITGTTNPPTTNPDSAASKYAGMGSGNYGAGTGTTPNTHANSQYDLACLHQVP